MEIKKGILDHKRDLTKDIYEIDIEVETPFQFEAGQFVTFKVIDCEGKPLLRSYSIVSSPKNLPVLTFCIQKVPQGKCSCLLYDLPLNSEIEFLGPFGQFLFQKDSAAKDLYFIVTNTGIAPCMAMFDMYLKSNPNKNFHLYFGLRHEKDIYYTDILDLYQRNYPNFDYMICFSHPEKNTEGFHGRVTQKVEEMAFTPSDEFYVCGNPNMVNDVQNILKEKKHISPDHIFIEKY